jgi:large subunit ribosomal protein L6
MSRIGKTPIEIPETVTVSIVGKRVVVKGPKGELTIEIPQNITVSQEGNIFTVTNKHADKPSRALHGFIRAEINNAIIGVTTGWTKTLELSGVGYRANVSGVNLDISVGFSHSVNVPPPEGITFAAGEGKIIVSGINKQAVGEIAAKIRDIRKPEPYKGKGIKYLGEIIRKKAGKAKAAGTTAGGAK